MAASVLNIYQCPRCEEHITARQKPKQCVSCGYEFPEDTRPSYMPPMTFSEQHVKYNNEKDMYKAALGITPQKAEYIVLDALLILQTIPGKICRPEDIRNLIGAAKSIGELANAYEAFLQARGKHVPSLYIKETDNESTSTTGADASASNPTDAG